MTPRLDFHQKHALSLALGEVDILADVEGRRLVVQHLPPTLRFAVPTYAVPTLDLFALVDTVLSFDDGFAALYSVVAAFAGPDSLTMGRLHALASEFGLMEGTA